MNSDDDVRQKTGSTHGVSEGTDESETAIVQERDGRIMAGFSADHVIEGDRETMVRVAERILDEADESREKTAKDKWEEHNESFSYDPPKKPADAWTSEEYQELYDRVISRRVSWHCEKCSGNGPMHSLRKARRHVESNHGVKLANKYATPRDELDTATDGGGEGRDYDKKAEENHGLGEFGQ